MGAMWREHKAERAEKRAGNRQHSAVLLREAGVGFSTRNDGAHLIIERGGKIIDFWPGTGLWVVRGQQKRHRGVRSLIQSVAANDPVVAQAPKLVGTGSCMSCRKYEAGRWCGLHFRPATERCGDYKPGSVG